MTKVEFFKMLDKALAMHNGYAKMEDSEQNYKAADFVAHCWSEDPEKLARWKEEDPKYPWVAHSSGYVLGSCWYVTVISHKTAKAAQKQHEIFVRWIAEYKAINK